jgi:Xaa-Pro aminopeptidase
MKTIRHVRTHVVRHVVPPSGGVLPFLALFLFLLSLPLSPARRAASEPTLANQPLSEYRARRQRLVQQVPEGVIVIGGAFEQDFGEVGRFRQHNYFQYLTGVEVPGSYLILYPKGLDGTREMLFIPPRNPGGERWTGPKMGPGAEAEAAFGFEKVLPVTEFKKTLARITATEKTVHTVIPRSGDTTRARELMLVEDLNKLATASGSATPATIEVRNIAPQINRLRQTKSDPEIAMIQKAIDATRAANLTLARTLKPGVYEYELEADAMGSFLRYGAERSSFPSIIGSGIYSTVLHYNNNRKRIESGDLVVVDIGAEYSYYAADITRTYPASGRFTPRQREIYDLVLAAQQRCEEVAKNGKVPLPVLTQAAREVFKASPLRAKDASGEERTMDVFFIHSTSHWLGMDVHDVGIQGQVLSPGDVFTIEPGIYIPSEQLGVRIEDDYAITTAGLRKLSAAIPSKASEIEALLKK